MGSLTSDIMYCSIALIPFVLVIGQTTAQLQQCSNFCQGKYEECIKECVSDDTDQECIRDCNRKLALCDDDCSLNELLILGRTDFPTYITNVYMDSISEFSSFSYHGHEVDMACSVSYQNNIYIFGGFTNTRSISRVKDCGLERIGFIPYNYEWIQHKCDG